MASKDGAEIQKPSYTDSDTWLAYCFVGFVSNDEVDLSQSRGPSSSKRSAWSQRVPFEAGSDPSERVSRVVLPEPRAGG